MGVHAHKTWYELLFKHRDALMDAFFVVLGVVALGFLADIRIPLWPVPITMQTFGIFLIAFFFGSLRGAAALIVYLLAGLLGFAVFAGSSTGLAPFIGPTGGYLIGFVFMAFFIGWMIEKGYGRTWLSILYVMLIGEIILYVSGLAGLWLYFAGTNPAAATLGNVLMKGFVPFIIGDSLKALAAAALFPHVWKFARTSQVR